VRCRRFQSSWAGRRCRAKSDGPEGYTSRDQQYPVQGARIFVESKAQKRRHSGATSSFYNAAIGEKMRDLKGVFLVARGITLIDTDSGNLASVVCEADQACYAAKAAGRNRWRRHDRASNAVA